MSVAVVGEAELMPVASAVAAAVARFGDVPDEPRRSGKAAA